MGGDGGKAGGGGVGPAAGEWRIVPANHKEHGRGIAAVLKGTDPLPIEDDRSKGQLRRRVLESPTGTVVAIADVRSGKGKVELLQLVVKPGMRRKGHGLRVVKHLIDRTPEDVEFVCLVPEDRLSVQCLLRKAGVKAGKVVRSAFGEMDGFEFLHKRTRAKPMPAVAAVSDDDRDEEPDEG